MYAEVNLTLDRRNRVLAVPVMAVDRDNSDSQPGAAQTGQVSIVTPNNRVEKRKVTLGIESSNNVEIRSGLNEGDSVVLTGRSTLQSGQEVRPKVTAMSEKTP
jgi:multidrug efflux pump subunit AcrA (membrane-fusion protein)